MFRRQGCWCALAVVASAIVASSAAAWPVDAADRYGPAPGGDSFAVVAGRPYVAYRRPGGVRVAKLAGFDRTWRTVGGLVHHVRHARVSDPTLIGGPDGHPWLTWVEAPAAKSWDVQVRVATFTHGHWREVGRGPRPINGPVFGHFQPTAANPAPEPARPKLVFYRGRPVVGFAGFDGVGVFSRFARLASNGRSWRALPGSDKFFDVARPLMAVAGGRLYAGGTCCFTEGHDMYSKFAQLTSAGNAWRGVGNVDPNPSVDPSQDPSEAAAAANVNGLFTVLWAKRAKGVATLNVSALGDGNNWVEIDPPLAVAGLNASGLDVAGDGTVAYAAYLTGDASTRGVQVGRLIRGEWQTLRTPTDIGYRGVSARFAPARGRGMWLLSGERANGHTRYVLDGYSVVPPPQLPR